MSFITRLLNIFPLSKSVFVSTRNDLDAKFRMADDADRDKLITDDLIDVGHVIYHEADGKHYKLKTYPTYGSLTGVVWSSISDEEDLAAINDTLGDKVDSNDYQDAVGIDIASWKDELELNDVAEKGGFNGTLNDLKEDVDDKVSQVDFDDPTLAGTIDSNAWKQELGISSVDNTSDADKPISTATQNALDSKLGGTNIGDEFRILDSMLYSNITTHRQTFIYAGGSQIFTLDFEPTDFLYVMIKGKPLHLEEYIYTAPNQLEILGTMESGDIMEIKYERFVNEPA